MKRLNRLVMLGLLGLVGFNGPAATAQTLSSIRIGLSIEGAKFLVDGQLYTHTQNFVWPEGSVHVVQFPTTVEPDGTPTGFQYYDDRSARYQFNGWTPTLAPGYTQSFAGNVETIVHTSRLTSLVGQISIQYPLTVTFQRHFDSGYCGEHISAEQPPNIDLYGVIFIDNQCLNHTQTLWVAAGNHQVTTFAYPGYAFSGIVFGNALTEMPPTFMLPVGARKEIGVVFEPAKRVRFSTYPLGLSVLVNRAPVTPAMQLYNPLEPINSGGDCTEHQTLPIQAPLNIPRLCVGDFDFRPGTIHTIGAEPVQQDRYANYWVFDHFNNGMGQNSTYIPNNNTAEMDHVQAIFVRGVQSQIIPNVNGLKVEVDGRTDWPVRNYAFIWGEGHTHHVSAPLTQKDSRGRVWRFVRWSDDGPREREISVPVGSMGYNLTAYFEVLGQITITTNPPGLPVQVDGADCATPCTFDQGAGQTLSVSAPAHIQFGESSRYDFTAWPGQPDGGEQTFTFDSEAHTYTAAYRGAHLVHAYSDPEGGAKFTFTPPTPDGFFPEGTRVEVKAEANPGFKFIKWGEDLNSRSTQDWFTVHGPMNILAYMEKVPHIAPAGIRNAASGNPDGIVAPGSIIAIYGDGLAEETKLGPSNPLAQAIANTWVTVNDRLLPLIFVSPTQINAQLLSSLGEGDYTLTVHNLGRADITGSFQVRRNAPGLFYSPDQDAKPQLSALHQDGTLITPQSPARRGETITFYGTGFGSYNLPTIDGFILPPNPDFALTDAVKIMAGAPQPEPPEEGEAAAEDVPPPVERTPDFAGGAAGLVGTHLVRFTVDPDLPAGKTLELYVTVNGAASNRVLLPVE